MCALALCLSVSPCVCVCAQCLWLTRMFWRYGRDYCVLAILCPVRKGWVQGEGARVQEGEMYRLE